MMALLLGDLAHTVDEGERLEKICELKLPEEVMPVHDLPGRNL
jgi:hypothetical protein